MENQGNLLKRIQSINGNHSKLFFTQHAQSDNFITPRRYFKNFDARKSFTIETRNQFQENVIEERLNNNELNHGSGNYQQYSKQAYIVSQKIY